MQTLSHVAKNTLLIANRYVSYITISDIQGGCTNISSIHIDMLITASPIKDCLLYDDILKSDLLRALLAVYIVKQSAILPDDISLFYPVFSTALLVVQLTMKTLL